MSKSHAKLSAAIRADEEKVYADHDAYMEMLKELKERKDDPTNWKRWMVNKPQQVYTDFKTFCLVCCALLFAKSVKTGNLPQALTETKLLNTLQCNFATMCITLPIQCAPDVAACLQWQRTHESGHAYEQAVDSLLDTLALTSQNNIVASPFLDRARGYLLKKGVGNSLPKKHFVGERDRFAHFIVSTVIGKLRVDVCPKALLAKLIQLDLVVPPYNSLYPTLSQNQTGPQTVEGESDTYTLVPNLTTIDQAMRRLKAQRTQLYPKVFYTKWR